MSKYKAVQTHRVIDGKLVRFASKKEARRYDELAFMERQGIIDRLELQPSYRIEVNGVLVCRYVADFRYLDVASQETVVEDVKGMRTQVYRLKRKLMKACHGIEIIEV